MTNSILEWFQGKDVLITGGSGFIGKGLIEKLLRCTEVNKVYLIIRSKKGVQPAERSQQLARDLVFVRLLSEKPDAFDRVKVIEGDMAKKGLGLSTEDKEELLRNISVVFHAAATVQFNVPLSDCLLVNVRGTQELVELAKSMKQLQCFQYISTAYCNCNLNLDKIKEKVYRQNYDWKVLVNMAETNGSELNLLQDKLLGGHPNTYTMCKSLAEMVLDDNKEDLPIVIFRPTVVIGSCYEPEVGWVDNINGPIGLTIGTNLGILRVYRANSNICLNYVPADFTINGIIVTAWKAGYKSKGTLPVFNCAYKGVFNPNIGEINKCRDLSVRDLPLNNQIWYPFTIFCVNTYLYHFLFWVLQIFPAMLLDLMLVLRKKKARLFKLNIKIYIGTNALFYFVSTTINFDTTNFQAISNGVSKDEAQLFYLKTQKEISLKDLCIIFLKGAKKFILKEKDEDLDRYKANHFRLYLIDRATRILLIALITWFAIRTALYVFI